MKIQQKLKVDLIYDATQNKNCLMYLINNYIYIIIINNNI